MTAEIIAKAFHLEPAEMVELDASRLNADDAKLQDDPDMRFSMKHKYFGGQPKVFSEQEAPEWLTSENTVKGSTMDCRWFWKKHVLTLQIGSSVDTDFHTITRIS